MSDTDFDTVMADTIPPPEPPRPSARARKAVAEAAAAEPVPEVTAESLAQIISTSVDRNVDTLVVVVRRVRGEGNGLLTSVATVRNGNTLHAAKDLGPGDECFEVRKSLERTAVKAHQSMRGGRDVPWMS